MSRSSWKEAEVNAIPVSILAVDDHSEELVAVRAALSSQGYEIIEATSGEEALLKLLERDFAVLLIDVVMPGINGIELANIIRRREKTASVPIVFLTGRAADAESIEKGYEAGGVDYLVKPFAPSMLRAKVAVFVELYRKHRRVEEQMARAVRAEERAKALEMVEIRLSSERHYRSLADAVPNIVWTARMDGSVDYYNRRWFEVTGISAEKAAGSWISAVHPDDAPRCRQDWEEALASGAKFQRELRLREARGTYRWHLGRAVPERGSSGGIVAWLGTFTDIEDGKRAQAALAEFKETLDAVLDAVFIFEADNLRLTYANQGTSALVGHSRAALLNMAAFDFVGSRSRKRLEELVHELRTGSAGTLAAELKFRRSDGHPIPVELSLQLDPFSRGRIISIARDISERKRAELERELLYRQAVEAVHARDDFMSIASHELRTPLTSLQLQLQSLLRRLGREGVSPVDLESKLEVAARQVDKLGSLIGELMDVSRIRAGKLQLETEEVDLAVIAREVVARLADDAARVGSRLELSAPKPVVGQWDRLRIDQVVTNLATNALKFGAGKPVEIAVEGGGISGSVSVRDHGMGIEAEDVDRIFRRFERTSSARSVGGMGLGLYIVRQIVDAHGGTIRVESQPGAGSSFIVLLPTERKQVEEESASAHESAGKGASREAYTVAPG